MPELPEVERMRRRLRSRIRGRRIRRAEILDRAFVGFGRVAARARLEGARILDVTRRAKFLLVPLDSGATLLLHMGMDGEAYLTRSDAPLDPTVRFRLSLPGGRDVRYRTVRKLGRIALARGTDPETLVPLRRLGVEPLSPRFGPRELERHARAFRGAVKCLLMTQHRIAGIGNLYSDEILFRARIHPAARGGRLDGKRLRALHRAIREVLREALRDRPHGRRGWLIDHRTEGARCPRCGARSRRLRLCGRSSYFCPGCQRR